MNSGGGWRKRSAAEIMKVLGSDPNSGLDDKRIGENRRKWCRNDLWYTGGPLMFLKPESGFSILGFVILAAASFTAAAFDRCADAPLVGIALFIGALTAFAFYIFAGIICRMHSEKWIPVCTVIRSGKNKQVRGDKLVMGDLVILEDGCFVPADMKLVTTGEVMVKESRITKRRGIIAKSAPGNAPATDGQSEVEDFIYAGSEIVSGSGRAVVCAVGGGTFVGGRSGRIKLISEKEPARLANLRKNSVTLGKAALIFAFAAVAAGAFSPISSADFIGLFLIFLSFAISVGGETAPALCCFMYSLSLKRCESKGVFLRDAAGVDYFTICDGVAAENVLMMKSGKSKLSFIWTDGKSVAPGSGEGDELFSLLIAGTGSGAGKYGGETLRAVGDQLSGRGDVKRFISGAETTKPVLDHIVKGSVHYSLFISGGEYYFTVTGSIEEVIGCCTKIRFGGRDVPMDRERLSCALSAASEAAKKASVIIACARRVSPYNSMKRLSVLTTDLTFMGFIAVETPADPDLADELAYLKREDLPFFFFTDGSGEDVNFARRVGIVRGRSDLALSDDPDYAVSRILSERSGGGAVVVGGADDIAAVLSSASKAGKRLIFVGHEYIVKGTGFGFVAGEPSAGAGAYITKKGRGEASVALGALRLCRSIESRFDAVRKYLLLSAAARALYSLSAVFGMPFVYPSAVLFWGLVLDFIAAAAILSFRVKKKD